jgi:hypothetical protein
VPIDAGRLKHLEMIQQVISRMASNSFLVKGWSVTLLSVILAIAVKNEIKAMAWVALLPCIMFWALDGYFLRQERLFRKLWDRCREQSQENSTDFNMNTSVVDGEFASWLAASFSKTLFIFHGVLMLILLSTAFVSKFVSR